MDKRTFEITGIVAAARGKGNNPFISASGNFSKLSLETNVGGKRSFHEVIGFSELTEAMRKLGPGMEVTVTGEVGSEKLADKAKQDILVDGYPRWIPRLVATSVAVKDAPEVIPASKAGNGW
jgi:hypothetical protein